MPSVFQNSCLSCQLFNATNVLFSISPYIYSKIIHSVAILHEYFKLNAPKYSTLFNFCEFTLALDCTQNFTYFIHKEKKSVNKYFLSVSQHLIFIYLFIYFNILLEAGVRDQPRPVHLSASVLAAALPCTTFLTATTLLSFLGLGF